MSTAACCATAPGARPTRPLLIGITGRAGGTTVRGLFGLECMR